MKFKSIFLFLLLSISLYATTLLTYNIYNIDNRVDIMLSFDTPYNGKIYLKKNNKNFTITLKNISFNQIITKNINSKIIDKIKIIPMKNNINIILNSNSNINISASKTIDSFGLRIRATMKKNINKKTTATQQNNWKPNFKTDTTNYSISRYYILIIFLIVFILILLYIKKKFVSTTNKSNWLFKPNFSLKEQQIKIIHRKQIDRQNSVVILEYKDKRYLVLTGNSNQLLDKFDINGKAEDKEEDFEKIFTENRKKLDEFLKVGNDKLSTYREKVSQD